MFSYVSILSALHILLVAVITIRVLLREDVSGSARLAWFIVVLTLPVLGLVVYLLLGEIRLSQDMRDRHRESFAALRERRPEVFGTPDGYDAIPAPVVQPFRFGQSINGFYPVPGNRVELFPDAATTQDRLIADIDGAKTSVNLLFYIWLGDDTGTEIAEALMRAAQRGVTVRAMADNLGSRHLIRSDLWRRMGAAGVQTAIAMPFPNWLGISLITRVDLRNHRKLTVIDGRAAYIGSKNAADPAFAPKARFGPWIDIMTRIEGPVVNQVQALFASDWMLHRPEDGPETFCFDGEAVGGGIPAQLRGTGPLERAESSSQMFCTLFELARDRLTITTPYFVPDAPVLSALQAAALRGVRVTLTLPNRNDSWIVKSASRGFYRGLLSAGVRIFEHGPGLLHSKIVTVDGVLTQIGSSNLDLRSFDLNAENDLLLCDDSLTAQVEARQRAYLAECREITLEDMEKRSMVVRLRDNIVATMGPVL